MSTCTIGNSESSSPEDYAQYRALSSAAVATLMVGMLSSLSALYVPFVAISLVALLLGVVALRKIKRNSQELTGSGLAKIGICLAVIFGIAGPSYYSWARANRIPKDSIEISYEELQPNINEPDKPIPVSAFKLQGKRVFIEGYVYPGVEQNGIKRFLLCRDQGECCFGGNPKITDRIEVTLKDPLRLNFTPRMIGVAGIFRVQPAQSAANIGAVLYHLEADHLQ